jgi:hypothetical protein
MAMGQSMEKVAEGIHRWTSREAEHNSRDWAKFDSKVLSYASWKKELMKHNTDVYPNLTVDHLKRVMMEKCLPEDIKDRICYKQTMEEVWEFLYMSFVRPNQYFHKLMKPILNARQLPEKDYRGLERYLEQLLHTFEQAQEAGMLEIMLHVNTLAHMFEKWPDTVSTEFYEHSSCAGNIYVLNPLLFHNSCPHAFYIDSILD